MKTNFAILQRLIDQNRSPSVQYFHFEKDKILAEFRSGVSHVLVKKPVDKETTYPLYSVTKTFTALAIFQLIEAGKIDVKSSAALYHPAFPYDHEITIQQPLTHTSGIPNPIPLSWIHLAEEHEGFDRNLFFRDIFNKNPKLKFTPGTRFSYSNLGYVLLGQIIEHVSGKTLEQYFFDHIIDPAGIDHHDLSFTMNDRTQATGYHKTRSFSNLILSFLLDKKKDAIMDISAIMTAAARSFLEVNFLTCGWPAIR